MMCAGKKQLDFDGDQTRAILMETNTKRAWRKRTNFQLKIFGWNLCGQNTIMVSANRWE
jgi:hypothetical protein